METMVEMETMTKLCTLQATADAEHIRKCLKGRQFNFVICHTMDSFISVWLKGHTFTYFFSDFPVGNFLKMGSRFNCALFNHSILFRNSVEKKNLPQEVVMIFARMGPFPWNPTLKMFLLHRWGITVPNFSLNLASIAKYIYMTSE